MAQSVPTVLVVDDDPGVRSLVVMAVERSPVPCEVDEADSLAAVVERLDQAASGEAPWPALMLLDLHLHGEDGLEALDHLRRATAGVRHVPVVVLSGTSSPAERLRSYARGASGFAVKPMGFQRLRDLLDPVLAYWLELMAPDAGRR